MTREAFDKIRERSGTLGLADEHFVGTYIEIGETFGVVCWVLGCREGILLDGHGYG
jgi:hypothetical protein